MRLDLAAGNDTFQAATGTGDNRKVEVEMDGPLVGPEVPTEADCQKLLKADASRSAWVVNEDEEGNFETVRVKFSGFQAVWVGMIMHQGEKLRGAFRAKKATEQQVRDAWHEFYLGAKAPGSGAPQVVMDYDDLAEYFDLDEEGQQEKLDALVEKIESKGGKVNY